MLEIMLLELWDVSVTTNVFWKFDIGTSRSRLVWIVKNTTFLSITFSNVVIMIKCVRKFLLCCICLAQESTCLMIFFEVSSDVYTAVFQCTDFVPFEFLVKSLEIFLFHLLLALVDAYLLFFGRSCCTNTVY